MDDGGEFGELLGVFEVFAFEADHVGLGAFKGFAIDIDAAVLHAAGLGVEHLIEGQGVHLAVDEADDGTVFLGFGRAEEFDGGHTHVNQLKTPNSPLKIGLSTHAPAQAQRALDAGADYIAIGPIYATGTKPTAKPVTLEYVRWAAAHVTVPWFAIGGVNLATLDAVLAAGARRICVVSAILNAPDIATACAEFRRRLA